VNVGSDSARAAAQTALGHGMALGVVICGCASLLGAAVTLLLVRKNTARVTVQATGESAVQTASA
jgi:hypothetical protein